MTGSTFKRCACRNPQTGKQYGQSCPKTKQKRHGLWNLRQQTPARKDGTRRVFRRSRYASQAEAQADLDKLRALLTIPGDDDAEGRTRIGDLLESAASNKEPIPDYEETKQKFATGQPLAVHTTVGEWLDLWLAGKKKLRKSGKERYETDIRVHLEPRIGHIRLDRLQVKHLDESSRVSPRGTPRSSTPTQRAVQPSTS